MRSTYSKVMHQADHATQQVNSMRVHRTNLSHTNALISDTYIAAGASKHGRNERRTEQHERCEWH